MLPTLRALPLSVLCLIGSAVQLSAAPITWQASGVISHVTDPFGVLNAVSVGLPWRLEFTFDPEAVGQTIHPSLPTTFFYAGAIGESRFTLGEFLYTNTVGDIAVNYGLPVGNGVSSASGPGLVQFQWLHDWSGGQGGPNLNLGLGLLLASYNDVNAVNGQIPTFTHMAATQSPMSGLVWDTAPSGGARAQFVAEFAPTPVPEPTTLLLLGTGVAALAARRARGQARRMRSS